MSRGLGKFTARARVGDAIAAEAELMAVVRLPAGPGAATSGGGMTRVAQIHPSAAVDAKAEIDDDVEIGAYSVVGPDVRIGARHRRRAARRAHRAHDDRPAQPVLPVRIDRRDRAGPQVRRRADDDDDRRRQRLPRIRVDSRRNGAGPRRHGDRRWQPLPCVYPRRARLRRRRPDHVLEQCADRRPRRDR